MGLYWTPVLVGALGVVLLLAVAVVAVSHLRRFTQTLDRVRTRTSVAVRPLTTQATLLKERR